jgi:hypothetical protein
MTPTAVRLGSLAPGSDEALRATLTRSLTRALPGSGADSPWRVEPVANRTAAAGKEFFMLTISAYSFQAIALMHFSANDELAAWTTATVAGGKDAFSREKLYDYLGEVGNIYCGYIKRDFNKTYPYLGMSTPNRLQRESLDSFGVFPFAFEAHVRATRAASPVFGASLYVCAYGDVDFKHLKEETRSDASSSSALELF